MAKVAKVDKVDINSRCLDSRQPNRPFRIGEIASTGVQFVYTDLEKDGTAGRGTFWPLRKFGSKNNKKIVKILRKFPPGVEIKPNG